MIDPLLSDDAFLADVESARAQRDALHLWWLGQSGFLVQWHERHLLFDPYLSDSLTAKYANTEKPHVRMTRRVIAPERLGFVDVVTSTHSHTDHLDPDTLRPLLAGAKSHWARRGIDGDLMMHLVVPASTHELAVERAGGEWSIHDIDAWQRYEQRPFQLIAVPAAHDQLALDEGGRHRYLGYVARCGPWTIYHSGDGVVYDGMAENVKSLGPIDIAILPINGKVGNMNGKEAAELAKAIGAGVVIPCHYEMFEFNTADPRERFIPECERLGQPYRVLRAGERMTLQKE
jgi:L-ascorbate metabolism protein UlaG (beta-lactamase superfamily)